MLFIILSSLLFVSSLYSSQPILSSPNEKMFKLLQVSDKVQLGDIDSLIKEGAQINVPYSYCGKTLLHIAVSTQRLNSLEIVGYLLKQGADINAVDRYGLTPLHSAACTNSFEVAKLLLKEGASINAVNKNGMTPLHGAACTNSFEVAELLLEEGASINAVNKNGMTPLHLAVKEGYLTIVTLLVKKGAFINEKDNNGKTSLDLAIEKEYVEVRKFLEEKALQKVEETQGGAFHQLDDCNPNLGAASHLNHGDEQDEQGYEEEENLEQTNLLFYEVKGKGIILPEKIEEHANNGADLNALDERGNALLHYAVFNGNLKMAEFLMGKKILIDVADKNLGLTPLHVAAGKGFTEMVKLLVNHNASINIKVISNGWTPLHLAAANGHFDIVEFLLQNGAQVDAKNNEGETPFDLAQDGDIKRVLKQTNLLFNALEGKKIISPEQIEEYVKNGAVLNATYKEGNTILHYVTQNNNPELNVADKNTKNEIGSRPSDFLGKKSPLNGDKKTEKKEDPTPKFPGSLGAQSSYISAGMKVGGVCLLASSLIYGQYESKNRIQQKQVESQSFMKKFLLFLKRKKLSATLGIVGTGLVTASFFAK